MAATRFVLEQFVKKTGLMVRIGPNDPGEARTDPAMRVRELATALNAARVRDARTMWVLVSLHVALFVLAGWTCWYWRDSPTVVTVLIGGSLLSLLKILSSLRDVWTDSMVNELVLMAAPRMSAGELTNLIRDLYAARTRARRFRIFSAPQGEPT
jgi:hypothetical protein